MRTSTIILSMLLILTSFLCFFFAYLWIDRTITLAYVNASLDSEMRARTIITNIIEREWYGKYEGDIYRKLMIEVEKHPEDIIILKKNDDGKGIEFDSFHFQFDNGKLINIE
ncbi:hypothetical protein JAG28_003286 [Citrobacter werkmanii]|nr:hypothetical protein [Citrobacter werkmanii]